MLDTNAGLKSRFTTFLEFNDLSAEACCDIVLKEMAESKPSPFTLADNNVKDELKIGFEALIKLPGWANGRDALEMFNKIIGIRDVREFMIQGKGKVIFLNDVKLAVEKFKVDRPAAPSKPREGFVTWFGQTSTATNRQQAPISSRAQQPNTAADSDNNDQNTATNEAAADHEACEAWSKQQRMQDAETQRQENERFEKEIVNMELQEQRQRRVAWYAEQARLAAEAAAERAREATRRYRTCC